MERHKCKLCLKTFANGRALGGHMRSHMLSLYVPPSQLGEQAESASSSSEEGEENEEEKGLLCYGLRENPKKSARLVDPEFVDAGSVVLQDRESETESSKNNPNPIRRRSKRVRKSGISEHHHYFEDPNLKDPAVKKLKWGISDSHESPVSSISDTSPEEDIAYCLMMLSRDKWTRNEAEAEEEEEEGEEDDPEDSFESDDSGELLRQSKAKARGKYRCETCRKVFRSYQALGGHRASHKKNRATHSDAVTTREPSVPEARNGASEEKIHECPVCLRVFSSGQALGGHKRSHVTGTISRQVKTVSKLIDLNLPAPIDDDEISQIELSVVSEALG